MPVQNYSINTRDAIAGQLYGMSLNQMVHSWKLDDVLDVEFATPLIKTGDRTAEGVPTNHAGTPITDAFYVSGLSVRAINKEQATRPGQGEVQFTDGEVMGVLLEGFMNVIMETIAVSGGKVFVDVTTGLMYAATDTNRFEALNLRVEQGNKTNGGIAVVQIANNIVNG